MIEDKKGLEIYYAIKEHFRSKDYDALKHKYHLVGIEQRKGFQNSLKAVNKIIKVYQDESHLKMFFIMCNLYGYSGIHSITGSKFLSLINDFKYFYKQFEDFGSVFENDVVHLRGVAGSVNDSLSPTKDGRPPILDALFRREISYNSFIILDKMVGAVQRIDRYMKNDTLWKKERNKILKYSLFYPELDLNVFKMIVTKVTHKRI